MQGHHEQAKFHGSLLDYSFGYSFGYSFSYPFRVIPSYAVPCCPFLKKLGRITGIKPPGW
jgi:hypothetical protein